MIVMKFGGSSMASAASLQKVVEIVRSERHRSPVIVASAMGDTTDFLLKAATEARNGRASSAIALQDAIKNQHFAVCEELLGGERRAVTEQYFRTTFRDLHVRLLELCDGERIFTPELQDWIVSHGEQWSSRLLAAVLEEHCGGAVCLDSRKLVLTNNCFTDAEPQYWETYARIRWTVPHAAREKLVVFGGFIGSTEDGKTTTLGRGGSDLTASMMGAAINADEVQVWKDVDGMLTCDPRVVPGGYQVKRLSYREATELAESGATILHPKTMEPAKRLRIPIVIRNTFHPANSGTRIEGASACGKNVVKSIAVRQRVTLLEASPTDPKLNCDALITACGACHSGATVLASAGSKVYVAIDEAAVRPDSELVASPCMQVRVMGAHAIITLVGEFLQKETVARRITSALAHTAAFVIPSDGADCSIRVAVPQREVKRCAALLHASFFTDVNTRLFAAPAAAKPIAQPAAQGKKTKSFAAAVGLVYQN